jgi:hypothetical protein
LACQPAKHSSAAGKTSETDVLKMKATFRNDHARQMDANREFDNRQDGTAWQWFITALIGFAILHWLDLPSWH